MTWRLGATILIVCSSLASCSGPLPVRSIDGGRYGKVKVIEPRSASQFVIFFSDPDRTQVANQAAADTIARRGAIVIEVDSSAYLKRLDRKKEKCHYVVGDVDLFSRQLERALRFASYATPVLVGSGEGGTLAELVLAQAPAVTIAGAVSLNPAGRLPGREPLCTDGSVEANRHGFIYRSIKSLPGYWTVGLTPDASKAATAYVWSLRDVGAPLQIREMHVTRESVALVRLMALQQAASRRQGGRLSRLPIVTLPVEHASKLMAVVLSGDGGWRDLDKTIAEDLQHQGVPVVGLDSLRYFWSKKSPERTANDLTAIIQTYMTKWRADKVALIGYSFGADVLPFVYDRLPLEVRSHVVLISLLAFSKSADFEIRPGGWLGLPPGPEALAVMPAVEEIPPHVMQCFYGADDTNTACPGLERYGAETIRTPGGHHFNGDYAVLERDILTAFKQRATGLLNSMKSGRGPSSERTRVSGAVLQRLLCG